jgi:hypothetical protein
MDEISRAHSIVGFRPKGRPDNDFYPTPPEATQKLLNVEKFDGGIWECACGNGAITRVLIRNGYYVFESDIEPRNGALQMDFLLSDALRAGSIVTNPPFKLLCPLIERAHALKPDKFAFLAKLTALEGGERSEILERTKLTRVHVFRNRIQMTRNGEEARGSGMIAFAWFVWERGYTGKPMIGWI